MISNILSLKTGISCSVTPPSVQCFLNLQPSLSERQHGDESPTSPQNNQLCANADIDGFFLMLLFILISLFTIPFVLRTQRNVHYRKNYITFKGQPFITLLHKFNHTNLQYKTTINISHFL